MALKKKKAAKKKAAPRKAAAPPKPAGVSAVLYFQDQVDLRAGLYRLTTSEAVSDGAGGLDLSALPEGEVDQWNGVEWLPAKMPPTLRATLAWKVDPTIRAVLLPGQ